MYISLNIWVSNDDTSHELRTSDMTHMIESRTVYS